MVDIAPAATSTFVPTAGATTTSTGTTIPLAKARFVLKGQYFDPIQQVERALPPHRFVLLNVAPKTLDPVLGEASDANGLSWIPFEDDGRVDTADGVWTLGWQPLLLQSDGQRVPLSDWARLLDIFLDLEKHEWVHPNDVGRTDRRKLTRLPLLTSLAKAKRGGFRQSPPKTKFAETGLLKFKDGELRAFGDLKTPWTIQIDHGLFRNYVRFYFYNVRDKARQPVPPGLVVTALGRSISHDKEMVAAGTAFDNEGTIYLLHERTKERSADVHYYFTAADAGRDIAILDFSEPDKNQRLRVVARLTSDLAIDRYVLPPEWHSYRMQGWTKNSPSGYPERHGIDEIRLQGASPGRPLSFHLDDAILGWDELHALDVEGARVALFDHLLHLRDADPKRPHVWKATPTRNYFPAERAIYVEGRGVERVTRLIYHEGLFFDLRDKRVQSTSFTTLGSSYCVGARVAVANDLDARHVMVSYMEGNPTMPPFAGQEIANGMGRGDFHMIDTSFLDHDLPDGSGGVLSTKLVHLLVFLPVWIDGSKVTPQDIEAMLPALNRAAEWWDQNHPAHPASPSSATAPVTVALIPRTGPIAGEKVVRVRHYFGEAPRTFPYVHTIHVLRGKKGGFTVPSTREITVYAGDIDVHGGRVPDVGQAKATTRFVLPHELAHALGHPDDYENKLAGHRGSSAWNPYEIAGAHARPFATDRPGLMSAGSRPRLRNYWNYLNRVRNESDFKRMLDDKDVALVTPDFAGGVLRYELPMIGDDVLSDPENKGPYVPIGRPDSDVPSSGRRAVFSLYRLGDDEGSTRGMFQVPGRAPGTMLTPDQRFDGLVIITVNFLIDFDARIDKHPVRNDVFAAINRLCRAEVGDSGRLFFATPFVIVPAPSPAPGSLGPPYLRRIGIGIVPRLDYVSAHPKSQPPERSGSHCFLRIAPSRREPHPFLLAAAPLEPVLRVSEIDVALLCHALGAPTFDEDPSTQTKTLRRSLRANDFAAVAEAVSRSLKDVGPQRRIVMPV